MGISETFFILAIFRYQGNQLLHAVVVAKLAQDFLLRQSMSICCHSAMAMLTEVGI